MGIYTIKRKLTQRAYQLFCAFYYRFAFGRETRLATKLARIVNSWEQRKRRGDVPVSSETWETQYQTGKWKYMEQLSEFPRYSTIIGYIAFLKLGGAILDVGCGEGILFERYRPYGYSKYLGIDISQVALAKLTQKQDENTSFVKADVETYEPTEDFDVIIFNETLYYFHEPLKVFKRYTRALKEDGIIIVETYVASQRAISILQKLKTIYSLLDETKTTHKATSTSWICSVFVLPHKDE